MWKRSPVELKAITVVLQQVDVKGLRTFQFQIHISAKQLDCLVVWALACFFFIPVKTCLPDQVTYPDRVPGYWFLARRLTRSCHNVLLDQVSDTQILKNLHFGNVFRYHSGRSSQRPFHQKPQAQLSRRELSSRLTDLRYPCFLVIHAGAMVGSVSTSL